MIRVMEGIDVHGSKGVIMWEVVRKSGKIFAFVKASEGLTFKDERIEQNLKGATAAGILVGPYHYARPDNRPSESGARAEATHFCRVIVAAGWKKELHARPVLDIEVGSGDLSAWADAFCRQVIALTGVVPIIYSYTYFIRSHLRAESLARYPLWLANYGRNDGNRHPVPPSEGPWQHWTVHQYTSKGSTLGVSGNCDFNFALALAPLRILTPPPVIGTPMWRWIRWRRGHGEFKPFGPRNPVVRPDVPAKVPFSWWLRLILNGGV
jgi:lysozyme